MSDVLAGALCVLAAMSAASSMRTRLGWQAGAAVVAACLSGAVSGTLAPLAAAFSFAVAAGLVSLRSGCAASILPASMQTMLVTIAFVAWLLPDAPHLSGALGGLALTRGRHPSRSVGACCPPLHLASAGACAALAYAVGAEPGFPAAVAVVAMLALIGAHLLLALAGGAGAPLASGVAACGLALAAASAGTDSALVVAAVTLAIACAQSSPFATIAREAL
ncbi:hypothetical protein BSCH_00013 [Candidatus Paraburkholderia schumanniana]|nr:hypothetical protein BSCH_00013 [Candidatus Paraburkholderia schumannianae]